MESKTNSTIKKNILKILETIPGIVCFTPIIDEDKDCIKIENNEDKLEISIGLTMSKNISSKKLLGEIQEALNFYFKNKKNIFLKKINIYIKGVK